MIVIPIPDNYDKFVEHDREQYEAERRRPKCECCGGAIWEDYGYRLGGTLYCERCIDNSLEYLEDLDDEKIPGCQS